MKYLIKDTTKEERENIVKNALAISNADGSVPTNTAIKQALMRFTLSKDKEEKEEER